MEHFQNVVHLRFDAWFFTTNICNVLFKSHKSNQEKLTVK